MRKWEVFSAGILIFLTWHSLPVFAHQPLFSQSLHIDWLDPKIDPSQNFYDYANGNWQKQNPIPPAYASWTNFQILQQAMQKKLQGMLIDLNNNPQVKQGSIEQKMADFYFSGMNEVEINQQGVKPLAFIFNRIDALNNLADLQTIIPELHLMGINVLFNFSSMQDFKNSKKMIGAAMQDGLGLPDRDYYFNTDQKFVKIRQTYLQHITEMFKLLAFSPTQASVAAKKILAFETTLAKASLTRIEQRDPYAIYHLMDKPALEQLTPNFSWPRYFNAMGLPTLRQINVGMPTFFKTVNQQLEQTALDDWKLYLRWQVINQLAPYLSQPFVKQNLYMNTVLTGTKKLLPRWQRVINTENWALDFAIGKLYVENNFSAADKEQVLDIMHNIRQAFRRVLATQQWMTPKTREAALRKLTLMEERVGYPDKWRDYSSLTIDRGPYVLNVIKANEFHTRRDLAKIGKPVDRSEWSMPPQIINAYYDPSMNNINILAGILQPPFFDAQAPEAVNYGAIGFVIGHEMTHGFDDQGALFDGEGNLKNWWTAEDLKKFKAATDCIVHQYSQYKVAGNTFVQGRLVVGEATADLGGVMLAYQAFHASEAYRKAKTIQGFTPDQQFFLGVAHAWAGNIRPELARHLATVDPHPPMKYRVNGTLANMKEFQEAFAIKTPAPMVNNERCVIW